MIIGGLTLSRARGAKAQKRIQSVVPVAQNTISFNPASRSRPIDLIPRTRAQEQLTLALLDNSIHVAVAVGPAGTGKTYLAMLAAIRALRAGACQKIVLTRPAVGVEEESHGFLPGDLASKMEPWTRPLFDVLREYYHARDIVAMLEDQTIEIAPLAYMRGRTFKRSYIIADEMQNSTPNQMKMLLTRIGEGSKIVVTGDMEQTDRARRENGLIDLVERLKTQKVNGLALCKMTSRDIQRHPFISSVLEFYDG